jgi:serine phosphatase RsbU (regulator of sigma subunit)
MTLSVKHQLRNLKALLELSELMGSQLQLDDLLQIILEKTTELMEAERSSLFIYDKNTNELWSKIAQGLEFKEIRFPIDRGIAGYVAKNLKNVNISDAYSDPRFYPEFDKLSNFKTRSILAVPLLGKEGVLVGVLQVINKKPEKNQFDIEDEKFLMILGIHITFALERIHHLAAFIENQKMSETLKLAKEIQSSILPNKFPPFPELVDILDIFAYIEPAHQVAGDLYNFFFLDDIRLCFVIGDVSGKGVPAALFMTIINTVLKTMTQESMDSTDIVSKLNNYICENNTANMFCTFFCGILNLKTWQVDYCNAGHNFPYILKNNGSVELLKSDPIACPLGIVEGMTFNSQSVFLDEGEGIFLYTDGITEAMRIDYTQYSEEALVRCLTLTTKNESSQKIIENVISDVKKFIDKAEQFDDITVLVLRRPIN